MTEDGIKRAKNLRTKLGPKVGPKIIATGPKVGPKIIAPGPKVGPKIIAPGPKNDLWPDQKYMRPDQRRTKNKND